MTKLNSDQGLRKKNRQRGKNKKIGFTDEVVTKEDAKILLSKQNDEKSANDFLLEKLQKEDTNKSQSASTKIKKTKGEKKIHQTPAENASVAEENNVSAGDKPKKRKKPDEDQGDKTEQKDSISKRAQKKMKFQKLLEEKRVKTDTDLKAKAQEYLSKWKYDKSNWKFKKLRQIWLIQHLYDSDKVEEKYWNTLVEYFSESKGKVHKTLLDEALKIADKEDVPSDEKEELKRKRARDIIMNLQE